jgi:hypothetical protein
VIAISDLSNPRRRTTAINRSVERGSKGSVSVSAAMAEWFRLTDPRLNMNANEMTAIRELTAQELNAVTGGSIWLLPFAVACLGVGLLIGDALGARTITMG